MQLTVDLPEPLLARLQDLASRRGIRLRDLLTQLLEAATPAKPLPAEGPGRKRSPLPAPVRDLKDAVIPALSNAEIQAILDEEDALKIG